MTNPTYYLTFISKFSLHLKVLLEIQKVKNKDNTNVVQVSYTNIKSNLNKLQEK